MRAYGISTNSVDVARAFNRDGKCAAVQLNYSLVNPGAGRDLLPWCAENDVGTLIRGPIAQGVLAGKFTPESRFDDAVRIGWNEGAGPRAIPGAAGATSSRSASSTGPADRSRRPRWSGCWPIRR